MKQREEFSSLLIGVIAYFILVGLIIVLIYTHNSIIEGITILYIFIMLVLHFYFNLKVKNERKYYGELNNKYNVLTDVICIFDSKLGIEVVIELIAENIKKYFNAAIVVVFIEEQKKLGIAGIDKKIFKELFKKHKITPDDLENIFDDIVKKNKTKYLTYPYVIFDLKKDEPVYSEKQEKLLYDLVEEFNLKKAIHVPFFYKEKFLGIVDVLLDRDFNPDEIADREKLDILLFIASHIGQEINNLKIFEEVKELKENLEEKVKEQIDTIKRQEEILIQNDKLIALGHLVAGVAHEINNPNTFIRSGVQTLKMLWQVEKEILKETIEKNNSKVKIGTLEGEEIIAKTEEIIESIEKGSERIVNIVNSLRSFSRKGKQNYINTNIKTIIDGAYTIVYNKLKHVADFELHVDDKVEDIKIIPQQIEQVFVNLFTNSIDAIEEKYKGKGRGKIRIDVSKKDEFLHIDFYDNGTGIDEDIINSVFDPFFTTKPPNKGTGLGLYILHNIITENHQGEIYVESKKNEYSIIHIKLPYNIK